MTWNKTDDNFYDSPRVVAAGLELDELAMYHLAETYSCRHMTDGLVPVQVLLWYPSRSLSDDPSKAILLRKQLLQRLLDVCFFAERPGGNIQIIDYLDRHESKADIDEKRKNISDIRSQVGRSGGLASGQARANRSNEANAKQTSEAKNRSNEPPLLSDPLRSDPGINLQRVYPPEIRTGTHMHARPTLSSPQSAGAGPPTSAPLAVKRTRQREEWDVVRDRHEAEAVPIATAHELAAAAVAQLAVIEAAAEQERRANQREPIRFSPEIIEQFRAIDPNYRPDDSEIRLVDEIPDSGRTDTNARAETVVLDLRRGAK